MNHNDNCDCAGCDEVRIMNEEGSGMCYCRNCKKDTMHRKVDTEHGEAVLCDDCKWGFDVPEDW